MIKKIIALATGALLSFNASASYTKYTFSGGVGGYVIQNDKNGAIADFRLDLVIDGVGTERPFRLGLSPQGSEGYTAILYETTYFRQNGPTNFGIYSNFGGDQFTSFDISFSRGTAGEFQYNSRYGSSIYFCGLTGPNCGFSNFSGTHAGGVTRGSISESQAFYLDSIGGYEDFVPRIVPTFINVNNVPEPASLALMAIGAFGALGAARRRKAAT